MKEITVKMKRISRDRKWRSDPCYHFFENVVSKTSMTECVDLSGFDDIMVQYQTPTKTIGEMMKGKLK